jgi:hypothetical protein
MTEQAQREAGRQPEQNDAEEQVPAQAEAIEDLKREESEGLASVKGGYLGYR